MAQNKQRNFLMLLALPLILIPAFVSAHKYEIGLNNYNWFAPASSGTERYDFFLYFKSRLLILTGVFIVLLLVYRRYTEKQKFTKQLDIFTWICIALYAMLILFSCLFSELPGMSFWGGYEQFEGGFVLLTYLLLFIYCSTLDVQESHIRLLYILIAIGVAIVGGTGAFQAMSKDFFQTKLGQSMMTMFEPDLQGRSLAFKFEAGRTYAMQYNPNYIGSYVALLLPVMIAGIFALKKWWLKIHMGILAICLIISLIGSESLTGVLGIILSILMTIILLIPKFRIYKKITIGFISCSLLACFILSLCKPDLMQYGLNKLFHTPKIMNRVERMENSKGMLTIGSEKSILTIDYNTESHALRFFENGRRINKISQSGQVFEIGEGAFQSMTVQPSMFTTYDQQSIPGLTIKIDGRTWRMAKKDKKFMFLNPFNRLNEMKPIEAIGFKDKQHFGSRRGYIWSRTLPLIKDYLFLGAGPDLFVLAFPNDDYIGLENNNYAANVVTKPHNMFMQIAIQTGFLSLLCLLLLYGIYFLNSFRLYFSCKRLNTLSITGIGIFIGTSSYLATGLANDSTVTIAPLFWVMLGIGFTVNRTLLRTENTSE